MPKAPKKPHAVLTASQFEAVRSLVRRSIVGVLAGSGRATVKEIASEINRSPQALYRHMAILERAGLVVRAGVRGTGREEEVEYEATVASLTTPARELTPREREILAEIASADLRAVDRAYRQTVLDPALPASGADAAAGRLTQVVWLTGPERRSLNRELKRLLDRQPSSGGRAGAKPYTVVLAYAPWPAQESGGDA